jgi:hypothetical protein
MKSVKTTFGILFLTIYFSLGLSVFNSITSAAPPTQTLAQCRPLIISLDLSGSMNQTDPQRFAVSAVKLLIDIWHPCPVGLITYKTDSAAKPLLSPLRLVDSINPSAVMELFRAAEANRQFDTPMYTTFQTIRTFLNQTPAAKGAVLLNVTDGEPTDGTLTQVLDLLTELKQNGYELNNVGFNLPPKGKQLFEEINRQSLGATYLATNPAQLAEFAVDIYKRYKNQILVPLGKATNLNRTIQIDPFANRAILIVTKENNSGQAELFASNNQPVNNGWRSRAETHYNFYDGSGLQGGNYILQAQNLQRAKLLFWWSRPNWWRTKTTRRVGMWEIAIRWN